MWLLGLTSFFTDTANEAIYPLLPVYLTRVLGAGPVSLGLIEGWSEAVSSVLKVLSGHLSDRWHVRRPIVLAGYGLSSAIRPLTALVSSWTQLFAVRVLDRVGKGARDAPRDALLAACATPWTRGRIFGFHRAMDHAGAVLGPLLAAAFLVLWPGHYRTLFGLTLLPGLLAVWTLVGVRDEQVPAGRPAQPASAGQAEDATRSAAPGRWRELPPGYFALLGVLLVFALGNSADAFLLLRLSDRGVGAAGLALLWALLHVVKATTSIWGGTLSDRTGRRPVIAAGWVLYAIVYAGFAVSTSATALVAWFLTYGVFYGLSEGTEKALVADLSPAGLRGMAFGVYNAVVGIGSLCASVVFGLVWHSLGAAAAFSLGAGLAVLATVLLAVLVPGRTGGAAGRESDRT